MFFPPPGKEDEAIANYCFNCTVRAQCKDKADRLGIDIGVWGGERRKPD
jgi:hypothetical protein